MVLSDRVGRTSPYVPVTNLGVMVFYDVIKEQFVAH